MSKNNTQLNYDDINSFYANEDLIFFDVFCVNNEIIIVLPVPDRYNIICENIKIYYCEEELKLKEKIVKQSHNKTDRSCVCKYQIETKENMINICVKYENEFKNKFVEKYTLSVNNCAKKHNLTQTTLFKKDYDLIEKYCDYYEKQGVEQFIFYYNGLVFEELVEICKKHNIILLEWNFQHVDMSKGTRVHIAQMGQINHHLYKYGKPMSKYTIYNDLDEYMNVKNDTLINFINKNVDIYVFNNSWSYNISCNIPKIFEKSFYASTYIDGWRTKIIAKNDACKLIKIHDVMEYVSEKHIKNRTCDMIMYHFSFWSKKRTNIIKNCDNVEMSYKLVNLE